VLALAALKSMIYLRWSGFGPFLRLGLCSMQGLMIALVRPSHSSIQTHKTTTKSRPQPSQNLIDPLSKAKATLQSYFSSIAARTVGPPPEVRLRKDTHACRSHHYTFTFLPRFVSILLQISLPVKTYEGAKLAIGSVRSAIKRHRQPVLTSLPKPSNAKLAPGTP
jgi:hypothetical protein